jgi:hypothetical protein
LPRIDRGQWQLRARELVSNLLLGRDSVKARGRNLVAVLNAAPAMRLLRAVPSLVLLRAERLRLTPESFRVIRAARAGSVCGPGKRPPFGVDRPRGDKCTPELLKYPLRPLGLSNTFLLGGVLARPSRGLELNHE